MTGKNKTSIDDEFLSMWSIEPEDENLEEEAGQDIDIPELNILPEGSVVNSEPDSSFDLFEDGLDPGDTTQENSTAEDDNPFLSEEELTAIADIITEGEKKEEPGGSESERPIEPPAAPQLESSYISQLPDINPEREAEIIFLSGKKIKTPEEERFLAETKAHERAAQMEGFRRIVEEAIRQLERLPKIDEAKVNSICERSGLTLKKLPDFQACIEYLTLSQNQYSELSDVYENVYVVYQHWKRMKEKLFKVFSVISNKPSDTTREGEAYLYLSKISDEESRIKALLERIEISMKKVSMIRESVSRMITALEAQYTAFGALKPEMDYEGPVYKPEKEGMM